MRFPNAWKTSLLAAAAALCGLAGCGDRSEVTPVRGRVFLDDQPLKFGSVMFQPTTGQPARGDIQSDGTFILTTFKKDDGAKVGKHQVRVTSYASQDPAVRSKAREEGGGGDSLGASLIPEKYTKFATSDLEVAVLSGGNGPFIIKLMSEPPVDPAAADPSATAPDAAPGDTKEVDTKDSAGAAEPEPKSASPEAQPAPPADAPSPPAAAEPNANEKGADEKGADKPSAADRS